MRVEIVNQNKDSYFCGAYTDRDLYITMLEDKEREFVVTHNTNIKSVSYFTGREVELKELRQRIEERRKSVLVSGIGGIGKTQICRKLFEEYVEKYSHNENVPFRHIGYIEYSGDMNASLQNCLKYSKQAEQELNQEAAWMELEYLASDGKFLLFVDNVDKPMREDSGLQRLNSIPGTIVITSQQTSFSDEFELYRIGFLSTAQCQEIYEKIRFDGRKVELEEVPDLEYIVQNLAKNHTFTIDLLAHLARTKFWTIKRLRGELEEKRFDLQFHENVEFANIHTSHDSIEESYEKLYDNEIKRSYEGLYDNKTIFLSYNWHDGEFANRIDKKLSVFPNLVVKKDVRDIGPWKSIREFMKSIRKQDYAILIISDSYLRSKNCMFEVTEIMKESEYKSKILPAVVHPEIYDPLVRVKYIKYWQEECDKLEAAIRELEPANVTELVADLKRYKSIASSIGEFLSMVADMNNPDIQEIEKYIVKEIFGDV